MGRDQPVIVTKDQVLVWPDLAVVQAMLESGRRTTPAYVLEVDWATSSEKEREKIRQMAREMTERGEHQRGRYGS